MSRVCDWLRIRHNTGMDIERTRQVALYLASKVPDLFVVKFLKLLYYIDFISVREVGQSITKDTYFHLPYGPIPSFIKDNIGGLNAALKKSEESVLETKLTSIFDGILQLNPKNTGQVVVPVAGAAFDESKLSQYEKQLIDDVITDLGGKSTKELVEQCHTEPPYAQTNPSMTIPYELAFQLDVKQILPSRTSEFDKEIAFSRFVSS